MFTELNSLTPGYNVPQLNEVTNAYGITWGPLGMVRQLPFVIDGSARDAGNTNFTTVLRPGLLMGRVDTGSAPLLKVKQWDPTATDGTQKIAAILQRPINMQVAGSNYDHFVGYALVGGGINAKALCIASSSTAGISGVANEYLIRSQLYPMFQLSDDPAGLKAEACTPLLTLTATATLTAAQAGFHILVNGSGAVTLTLPAPATALTGLTYMITNIADQDLIVASGTADTMIIHNDLAADSVAYSTASKKIGGSFRFICTGTKWLVIPLPWSDGTLAQTITTAT
jgi:hypothetical protein